MSDVEYRNTDNGHPFANLIAVLALAAAVIAIIIKFLVFAKFMAPVVAFAPFVRSGWMIVLLSFVASAAVVVGLIATDDGKTREDPDGWFVTLLLLSLATFVVSLVWMVIHWLFF